MTDERDLRDPALDAAWRAQSTEMPPPPLDAAILAAAHRAVKSAPEKIGPGREATRPWRWWTPLAAAAVIGVIAIGALQLLPQEPDPTKVVVSDMPSAEPSPEKVASPAPAQSALRSRAAIAESAPRQERPMAAPPPAAPAEASSDSASREEKAVGAARFAPEPFPARSDGVADAATAPAAAPAAPAPAAESRASGRAGVAAGVAAAPPPLRASPAQSPAATADTVAPMLAKRAMRDETQSQRSAADFVAQIRKLLAESSMAEAQRELLAFRAAYADADARLPADLRPWAATIPRN